jgi:hypothetical protein
VQYRLEIKEEARKQLRGCQKSSGEVSGGVSICCKAISPEM